MKEKLIAALKRAAWTAAEVALAMIPVGAGLEEVNWLHILSVVATATVISLLKSVIISMPEVELAEEVKAQAAIMASVATYEPDPDPANRPEAVESEDVESEVAEGSKGSEE